MFFDSRLCLTLKRLFSNYKEIKKFLNNSKETKIIYFELDSKILFAHLKYDIFSTVSNLIESAKNHNLKEVDLKIKQYLNDDWPENIHNLKLLLKLIWLIKNLRNTEVKNPFQLLFCGDGYFCHPGTTRLLVSCYLLPTKKIKGFYLWNKNLDKNPFILNYYHKEIKNSFYFLKIFSFLAPFKIKYLKLSEKTDCSDSDDLENSNRMFQMAQKCFLEYNDTFEIDFLTFHQSIHWEKIKKGIYLNDNITFHSEDFCTLAGINFKKINNFWIKQD